MTRICCVCDRASHKSLSAEHASSWAWSPAATGKIFCSFCAFGLPAGKAKGAETAKEKLAEAGPLHEDELDFHYDWQDHRAAMRLFVEKLAQRVLDLVFDE